MNAITFLDVEELKYEETTDPELVDAGDAIIAVEAAGVCGSDLHPYHGRERGLDRGTIMGHEFGGRVAAVGSGVRRFEVGDHVVSPFSTSCGECWACTSGLTSRCIHGQLFGWVQDGQGLQGGQAEYVRVPLADTTLVTIPDELPDPTVALLAGDVLSTAIFGAELARVKDDDCVAIVGCGAVGLLAIRAALARGARTVFALDLVPSRLELAAEFGARPLSVDQPDLVSEILDATDGRGADSVIEAVGSPAATETAAQILRPGGTLAAVGVHTEPHLAISPGSIYDRNLTYSAGRCPARRIMPEALKLAAQESDLVGRVISQRLPLAEGVEAYARLAAREEGWVKVVLEA